MAHCHSEIRQDGPLSKVLGSATTGDGSGGSASAADDGVGDAGTGDGATEEAWPGGQASSKKMRPPAAGRNPPPMLQPAHKQLITLVRGRIKNPNRLGLHLHTYNIYKLRFAFTVCPSTYLLTSLVLFSPYLATIYKFLRSSHQLSILLGMSLLCHSTLLFASLSWIPRKPAIFFFY